MNEEELTNGEEPLSIVLERQTSYFADEDGLNGLLKHLGDSPWCEVLKVIQDGFNKTNPRKPFSLWKNVDADYTDHIGGLTNFWSCEEAHGAQDIGAYVAWGRLRLVTAELPLDLTQYCCRSSLAAYSA